MLLLPESAQMPGDDSREQQLLAAIMRADGKVAGDLLQSPRVSLQSRHCESLLSMMQDYAIACHATPPVPRNPEKEQAILAIALRFDNAKSRMQPMGNAALRLALANLAACPAEPGTMLNDAYFITAKMMGWLCKNLGSEEFDRLWDVADKDQRMALADEMLERLPAQHFIRGEPKRPPEGSTNTWIAFIREHILKPLATDNFDIRFEKQYDLRGIFDASLPLPSLYAHLKQVIQAENPRSKLHDPDQMRNYTAMILMELRKREARALDDADSSKFFFWRSLRHQFARDVEKSHSRTMEDGAIYLPESMQQALLPDVRTQQDIRKTLAEIRELPSADEVGEKLSWLQRTIYPAMRRGAGYDNLTINGKYGPDSSGGRSAH